MTTTLRAAIMLATLVGLPAAWLYYGPLPDHAQRTVDRWIATAQEALIRRQPSTPTSTRSEARPATSPAAMIARVVAPPAALSVVRPAAKPTLADRLEPLLGHLRACGVAAYDLEAWGADRRLYRFTCEAPVAGSHDIIEQFEAVEADPAAAVEQVLAEVTNWQAERLAAR